MSVVIVTGATGATGRATCAVLVAAGHHVAAVDLDSEGLDGVAADVSSAALTTHTCDLTDAEATRTVVDEVRATHGRIDGLVHLVGGWRGGKVFTDNVDADWAFLSSLLIDTLRHVTLAVHDDLVASPAGRAIIVSAASVAAPTAGNANYVAAKAAAEAWIGALADSFRSSQKSGRTEDARPQTAAAVVGVVGWIGDGRTATTPARLAEGIREMIEGDATALNGARVDLRPDAAR